jgi:hypothetical protein
MPSSRVGLPSDIGRGTPTGSTETLVTHSVQKGMRGRSSGLKLPV